MKYGMFSKFISQWSRFLPNTYVLQRLSGLRTILNGTHQASKGLSSCTTGQEREAFIKGFLAHVLPPVYRFGTGDATDMLGNRSGQLDVVVEHPIGPSLPLISNDPPRLYLAESIAAVIEIKSDLAGQWDQVRHTSDALAPLRKHFTSISRPGSVSVASGGSYQFSIPLIAVGYTGWKKFETLNNVLAQAPNIHAALIVDAGIYIDKWGSSATDDASLWALIDRLHKILSDLEHAVFDPLNYVR